MTDDHSAAREQTPLQLAHEYAICFAEWRRRHGWRPFSTRQRFDAMTDEEIELALDAAKQRLAALDPAAGRVCVSVETARFIKRELNRLSDHEQFEDADVAEQHRRELEDAITEATTG